jgi:hypothetical protein
MFSIFSSYHYLDNLPANIHLVEASRYADFGAAAVRPVGDQRSTAAQSMTSWAASRRYSLNAWT